MEELIDSVENIRIDDIEEWRCINDYPGYFISSLGRLKNSRGRLSNTVPRNDGYIQSHISVNGKDKTILRHVFVAKAFIDNPDKKPVVNHINGIRCDNRVSNLEWVTHKENCEKVVFKALKKSNTIAVNQFTLDGEFVKTFESVNDAILECGAHCATFHNCLNYKIELNGFLWVRESQIEVLQDEEWVIVNYQNISIPVSSLGRVKTVSGKITYGSKTADGYMVCKFDNKTIRVHRLVMLGKDPRDDYDKYVVDHINENKSDNRIENLRWATIGENNQFSHNSGSRKTVGGSYVSVSQYTLDNVFIRSFKSIKEAGMSITVSSTGISACCRGVQKTAGGYKWKFS